MGRRMRRFASGVLAEMGCGGRGCCGRFRRNAGRLDHPAPGEWHTLAMRRADALARIAESFLAHGAEALASGERHHVVVHIDAETLREGGDGRCEHEHGPPLPVETARRLGCDASVVAMVEDAQWRTAQRRDARRARSHPLFGAPSSHATRMGVGFLAAPTSTMSTVITSSTGRMAGRRAFPTSSFCAGFIIGWFMRAGGGSGARRWRAAVCCERAGV